jgi:hypothetical protein
MLGSDKSRGYCLEMICADFLAGAHMDGGNPEMLLQSISRYYKFLPSSQRETFLSEVTRKASCRRSRPDPLASGSIRRATGNCADKSWCATAGDARIAVACSICRYIT